MIKNGKYRFFFAYAAAGNQIIKVPCYPLGLPTLKDEKQDGQKFFRRKLSGDLTFKNDTKLGVTDFSFIKSIEDGSFLNPCSTELLFIWEKKCNNVWSEYWEGVFYAKDGAFDNDACEYSVQPDPNDEYRCLTEKKDIDKNILELTPASSIFSERDFKYETVTCVEDINIAPADYTVIGAGCVQLDTSYSGGAPISPNFADNCLPWNDAIIWNSDYIITSGNPAIGQTLTVLTSTTWIRELKYVPYVGGVWVTPGATWTDRGQVVVNGIYYRLYTRRPLDLVQPSYDYVCYNVLQFGYEWNQFPDIGVTYDRGRWLNDVIESFADDCNLSYSSSFFQDGINPVTGLTSQTDKLLLVQKSDAKDPTSTEQATIGNLTFAELERYCMKIFNVYWTIENGVLKFEHESYFDNVQGLDLTQSQYLDKAKNKYAYRQLTRPEREVYKWAEQENTDFVGVPIIYDSRCAERGVISETIIDKITTDVWYVQGTPSDISSEGFVLLATDGTDVIVDSGVLTQLDYANAPLSWANLQDAFSGIEDR